MQKRSPFRCSKKEIKYLEVREGNLRLEKQRKKSKILKLNEKREKTVHPKTEGTRNYNIITKT